jgi:nitrous oxidase accessory protein NosD
MIFNRTARISGTLVASLLVSGALMAQAGAASASTARPHHIRPRVLYVSRHAQAWGANRSCGTASFRRIQPAVNAARPGGTVVVCPGTYHEQVVVAKALALIGRRAIIDQAHVTPRLKVSAPGLGGIQRIFAGVVILHSRVSMSGFTVRDALGEGILAAGVRGSIRGISIQRNVVVHNDLGGGVPPVTSYFECKPMGQVPNDCGEGVHFLSVENSVIRGNVITRNSGGVLMTDETGPTDHNLVAANLVTRNAADCGITVPGHNPHALSATGRRQPSVAGVYDNVIRGNTVTANGLKGDGAGVLFANATAGTASYDNLVAGNRIAGNGLSGVTMHAHTLGPGQFEDLSGNKVIGNVIGKNNIDGDPLDSPASPKDDKTTGVLVFSGGPHITVTIARNRISDNAIGIWLSKPVTAHGLRTNVFRHVTTPISANH